MRTGIDVSRRFILLLSPTYLEKMGPRARFQWMDIVRRTLLSLSLLLLLSFFFSLSLFLQWYSAFFNPVPPLHSAVLRSSRTSIVVWTKNPLWKSIEQPRSAIDMSRGNPLTARESGIRYFCKLVIDIEIGELNLKMYIESTRYMVRACTGWRN